MADKNLIVIFLIFLMIKALGVRMAERAIIYRTTTTAPVRQATMVGLAKVSYLLIVQISNPILM